MRWEMEALVEECSLLSTCSPTTEREAIFPSSCCRSNLAVRLSRASCAFCRFSLALSRSWWRLLRIKSGADQNAGEGGREATRVSGFGTGLRGSGCKVLELLLLLSVFSPALEPHPIGLLPLEQLFLLKPPLLLGSLLLLQLTRAVSQRGVQFESSPLPLCARPPFASANS
jgi:hypothetical protein